MSGKTPTVVEALPAYATGAPEAEDVPEGYRRTEVGVIPEDWQIVPLSELLDFRNGVNADKSAYGQGTPFINVLEVITRTHLRGSDIPGRVTVSNSLVSSYAVRRGDILFNRTSETQEEVGLASVYLGDETVVFGGFVIRGRSRGAAIDNIYSGYAFRSPIIRSQIISKGQGAVRANIGQQELSKVVVALPPLPEQRAIAAALSDVDALISSLDRLISKKRALKAAAMQQLLTGKQRLPGFGGKWEVKRLGDIGSFSKGRGLAKHELSLSGTLPAIPYTAIYTDFDEVIDSSRLINFTSPFSGAVVINSPHLLIAGSSNMLENIGKVTAFKDYANTVVGGDIILYKTPADVAFLSYLLNTRPHRESIISLSQGSTIRHVYAATFRDYEVSLPGIEEQTAIAAVLSDMDAEISALEARREKTRQVKQGMIQELLTGSTRLVGGAKRR
jgi:type I restriction enzyme S subunit